MTKRDRDVIDHVMAEVDRVAFLPVAQRGRASFDGPIRIGFGQTNSQPRTVANMLRLLDVRPGQRVLDVGSGSGWSTALLGELVGPTGCVIGVERVPELVERSRSVLDSRGRPWIEVRQARAGIFGWPEDGPFDRILVSAEAQQLPESLVEQLAVGGKMVLPVSKTMLRVVRHADGREVTQHGAYVFVPLIED